MLIVVVSSDVLWMVAVFHNDNHRDIRQWQLTLKIDIEY